MSAVEFCEQCGYSEEGHPSPECNAFISPNGVAIHIPCDSPELRVVEGIAGLQSEPRGSVPRLASEPDILTRFTYAIRASGVVGEDRLAKIEFLAICSRLLDKPTSLVVKGSSSSGKSYVTETTCRFFPARAVLPFTGMSEKALILSERSFSHRTIVVYEATALRERAERQSGDQTAYYLRSLVSEGETHYDMSVRAKDGSWTTKRFDKHGPTNVIVTTTAVNLHNENETRMLSLQTDDRPEQTAAIFEALADESQLAQDYTPWHELQDWLFVQDNRVTIPYAPALARSIPPVAVRLRRDFGAVLSLIRSHAVLHQATRDRDEQGRIVATEDDYAAVRDLVIDVVSQGVGATVPASVRETVEAVGLLVEATKAGVSSATVAPNPRVGHLGGVSTALGRGGRRLRGQRGGSASTTRPLHPGRALARRRTDIAGSGGRYPLRRSCNPAITPRRQHVRGHPERRFRRSGHVCTIAVDSGGGGSMSAKEDPYGAALEGYLLELVVAGLLKAKTGPDGEVVYWCEDPDALNAYFDRGREERDA